MSVQAGSRASGENTIGPPETAREREQASWRASAWTRWGPRALVALSVGFGLWVLRAETTVVPNLNDSAVHKSMISWAEHTIRAGRVPLDGWYPYFQTGSANFHHYQSLPHILTGFLATLIGADHAFTWTLYLLLALWPISVYWCSRLLGWGRWVAAAAALVAPLLASFPGYGFEHASYTWRGSGMWSMVWGMWTLPLAWGFCWQAVSRKRHMLAAVVFVALTIAFHFLTAYLALLALGVWVLVSWSGFLGRLGRAALIGAASLLTTAWVIVPLLTDAKWIAANEFDGNSFWVDSYGARKILGWLVTGRLYDEGRFPIITLLVAVGLIVCGLQCRSQERARALLGVWILSMLLYFGRPTMGWAIDLIPGSHELRLHRYISGVHLAGILLAGVGAVAIARAALRLTGRVLPWVPRAAVGGIAIALGIAVLIPAWTQVAAYDSRGAEWIDDQVAAQATDGADLEVLLATIKSLGGGRVYGGLLGNWGRSYTVSSVPVLAILADRDIDSIGFSLRTPALMTNVEPNFDETKPGSYDLLGIRFLLMPADRKPAVPATLIQQSGRHTLWIVDTTGFVRVIDTIDPLAVDHANIGAQTRSFTNSELPAQGLYPTIAFGDTPAATPTLGAAVAPSVTAGVVGSQKNELVDGKFTATVVANRESVVLLKSSYDPRWKVTVDGRTASTQMVAPAYVGVTVGPGRHVVRFAYESYPYYPFLLLIGALTLFAIGLTPRIRRRRAAGRANGSAVIDLTEGLQEFIVLPPAVAPPPLPPTPPVPTAPPVPAAPPLTPEQRNAPIADADIFALLASAISTHTDPGQKADQDGQ